MKFISTLLVFLVSTAAFAQEAVAPAVEVKNYSGESEASSIVVSGNSNSETYGLKSANTYNVSENDILGLKGRYIRSTSAGSTTAEAWMAALRYERVLSKDLYTGFIQQTAEADPYNGVFIQRDSTDVGFKYFITKTDDLTWFAEFGYRYTSTYTTTPKVNTSNLRAYTEGVYKVNANTTVKAWLELLPNLTTSKNYLINSEISLAVSMSKMFSLKTGLLVNYNNGVNNDKNGDAIAGSNLKNTSTAWTTALVASY